MMVEISEQESEILGIRVGRAHVKDIDVHILTTEIESLRIDVLKLMISPTAPDLYQKLDELSFPYYVLGMVIEYKSNFNFRSEKPYLNDPIKFIEYQGEKPEAFKQLIQDIFQFSPASYYVNPGIIHIIDEKKQMECLAAYINTLNRAHHPDYFTHILQFRNETAGFITSFKRGNGGAATYGGILQSYEGKGLYLDMIHFIQNFGKSIGQRWGKAYVQLQNTVVQKAFQRGGLSPSGYELNIHVNSFQGNLKNTKG